MKKVVLVLKEKNIGLFSSMFRLVQIDNLLILLEQIYIDNYRKDRNQEMWEQYTLCSWPTLSNDTFQADFSCINYKFKVK